MLFLGARKVFSRKSGGAPSSPSLGCLLPPANARTADGSPSLEETTHQRVASW